MYTRSQISDRCSRIASSLNGNICRKSAISFEDIFDLKGELVTQPDRVLPLPETLFSIIFLCKSQADFFMLVFKTLCKLLTEHYSVTLIVILKR